LNHPFDRSIESNPALNWRVLGLLNLYRVLVPLVLLGLYSLGGARGIGVNSPQVFFSTAIFYLCFGLANVIFVRRRLTSVAVQTLLQAAVDMVVSILLLHAWGGVASGLGLLFLLPVGGLAFLLNRAPHYSSPPSAAIAVLADTIWQQLSGHTDIASYATAGLLGSFYSPSRPRQASSRSRMRESERSGTPERSRLANLAELSQYIVQHLRESLLVVDGRRQDQAHQ